jgi:hypothetical protein
MTTGNPQTAEPPVAAGTPGVAPRVERQAWPVAAREESFLVAAELVAPGQVAWPAGMVA